MRTKTMILSALIGLASSAAVMAQTNVYSLNAVGYVNVTIAPGWNIFANPLNATSNSITNLIPSIEPNTQIFKFNGAGYDIATFDEFDLVWYFGTGPVSPSNPYNLNPGEGAYIRNPFSTNWVFTFVGEVPQGSLTNQIPTGFSMKSSIVPQTISVTNFTFAHPNDQVFKLKPGGTGWDIANFDEFDLVWYVGAGPATPANDLLINVGEGIFYKAAVSTNWIRTFSVNN